MRKILSFILMLTLILGSFSMACAATPSDVAGTANEEAVTVLMALGVVDGYADGTYKPTQAVTRAEMAKLIVAALGLKDRVTGATSKYPDMSGAAWAQGFVSFSTGLGIIQGYPDGTFKPNQTVSYNEAMTMIIRALGYTDKSLTGNWPANYITEAQTLGIFDDVKAAGGAANRGDIAQMLYNALDDEIGAVNTDGTWKGSGRSMLDRLGAEFVDADDADLIFGDEDTAISLRPYVGAYADRYLNKDGDIIKVVPDSVHLRGEFDGSDTFTANGVDYNVSTNAQGNIGIAATQSAVYFLNGLETGVNVLSLDPGLTGKMTYDLWVDLSGKTIKEIYSVDLWYASAHRLFEEDDKADITENQELYGYQFMLDDNNEIDLTSFDLFGVGSLDQISAGNAVYVGADGSSDQYIRRVMVGTQTFTGKIEETTSDGTITIDGKDYDKAVYTNKFEGEPGDTVRISLDVFREIYNMEIIEGTADTYGIVKAYAAKDNFNNDRFKLYKSDGSTSTHSFAEDNDTDMDWTVDNAASIAAIKTTGALIGYSLDGDGNIDAVDNSRIVTTNAAFQSTKVLKINNVFHTIDSKAVVFTYKTNINTVADYDVAKLNEVQKGTIAATTTPASFILNDDGDVVAMFLDAAFVKADDDDVYGVFNVRKSATKDGDNVYKLTGYIDKASFTKYTDDRGSEYDNTVSFTLYKITVDTNGVITKVSDMNAVYEQDSKSGYIAPGFVIGAVSSDKTVLTNKSTNQKWTVADDAAVYKWDADNKEFTVAKLSSLKKDYIVKLFDTKGKDADGIATVVIYMEN